MKVLDNGKIKNIPLFQIPKYFQSKAANTATASGEKLWGFRGNAPNAKKLPIKESLSHCTCNRCRLSLQALPTEQI